jgi:hypothetical protein
MLISSSNKLSSAKRMICLEILEHLTFKQDLYFYNVGEGGKRFRSGGRGGRGSEGSLGACGVGVGDTRIAFTASYPLPARGNGVFNSITN